VTVLESIHHNWTIQTTVNQTTTNQYIAGHGQAK
jgi:hypothetical protein